MDDRQQNPTDNLLNGDWSRLTSIVINFSEHSNYPEAQKQFHLCYGCEIYDLGDLFTDNTQTRLRDDAIDVLYNKLTSIIATAATETKSVSRIAAVVKCLSFTCHNPSDGSYRNLREVRTLANYMTRSLASGNEEISIIVNINRLFIDQRTSTRYLNFDSFSITPFPEAPPSPVIPTLSVPPPAGQRQSRNKIVLISRRGNKFIHETHRPNQIVDSMLELCPENKYSNTFIPEIIQQIKEIHSFEYAFVTSGNMLQYATEDEIFSYLQERLRKLRERNRYRQRREDANNNNNAKRKK